MQSKNNQDISSPSSVSSENIHTKALTDALLKNGGIGRMSRFKSQIAITPGNLLIRINFIFHALSQTN